MINRKIHTVANKRFWTICQNPPSRGEIASNDIIRLLPGVDYYPLQISKLIIVKSSRLFFLFFFIFCLFHTRYSKSLLFCFQKHIPNLNRRNFITQALLLYNFSSGTLANNNNAHIIIIIIVIITYYFTLT